MITLLGSLLGFLASFAPELLKMWSAASDRKQELAILQLQMQAQKDGYAAKLEEINSNADIAESQSVHLPMQIIGIKWVDALNDVIRPILTLAYFFLMAFAKVSAIISIGSTVFLDNPWIVWSQDDGAIWASIISFWFGGREMKRYRDARAGK